MPSVHQSIPAHSNYWFTEWKFGKICKLCNIQTGKDIQSKFFRTRTVVFFHYKTAKRIFHYKAAKRIFSLQGCQTYFFHYKAAQRIFSLQGCQTYIFTTRLPNVFFHYKAVKRIFSLTTRLPNVFFHYKAAKRIFSLQGYQTYFFTTRLPNVFFHYKAAKRIFSLQGCQTIISCFYIFLSCLVNSIKGFLEQIQK